MTDIDLGALMAEVGPQDDDILAVVETPDGAHAIRFEDIDVLAEWDETRLRLTLSTEIGTPPHARTSQIYSVLLTYNVAWRATGGVSMALTQPGGDVIQLVDLAGPEINAKRIAIVAVNLAERTRIWRAFFQAETGPEQAAPELDADALMIRI